MDYLKKIHSSVAAQVHQVAAQVNLALPGNPIFREYTVGPQIASAGPGLCWKIYTGTKNSTKQEVAIWLFEKKQTENWLKVKRDELPEMLKKGVSQLTRLRHPRILTVERALEESRDCFAFCTEPIFASLANCFGDLDNILNPPRQLKGFELQDVEIRHGLFQITEALAFLHNDTKMIHGNISPNSIIINSKGAWKLGGFDFCIVGNISTPGKVSFDVPNWSQNSISALSPGLDYVSPELAEGAKCDPFADIFSLGVLAFAAFNKGKPLFESQNSFACYRKSFDQLKNSLSTLLLIVPDEIREDIKMCLNQTPELRPDAIQFTKLPFFDHPLVKTLNFLDTRNAMENTQKMQFFKGLPAILPQFPQRVRLQKVYPHLAAEYSTPILVPFILQSVFLIAENASTDEFANFILPSLVTVFPIQTPYQIGLLLLQRVNLFLEKMPTASIKQHLLPLIYNSLSSESIKIQEICLSEVPNVVKYVDREQMRSQLLPKLLRMVLESREVNIRVQSMVCLAKLLDHLEGWMVTDQLLPALPKVNSKDPAVLMAVLGIYKMVFESQKFGISKDQCAKSVLPFLISTSVESTLNLGQFNQFVQLAHQMLEKVESEQRQALQQLSASQEEQRKITDFADFLNSQTANGMNGNSGGEVDLGDLAFMIGGNGGGSPTNKPTSTNSSNKVGLSLEEKKKMAAEKEQQKPIGRNEEQQIYSSEPKPAQQQQQRLFDPFPSLALASSTSSNRFPPSSSIGRPANSQQNSGSNPLDLLAEFMPPSSSSAPSTRPSSASPFTPTALQPSSANLHAQPQSASFTAAFPSIPLPTASSNPIQRRIGPAGNNHLIDPFDSILGSTTKAEDGQKGNKAADDDQIAANFFSQLNKGKGGGGNDPFRDLLS